MIPHPEHVDGTFVILMIDDDEDDFILVRDALKARKQRVELYWAEDGEEALKFLRQDGEYRGSVKPHLILLDLNMPRKDGFEVLRDLKAHSDLRKIPVVILTSSRDKKHVAHGYNYGANSFMLKPLSFTEMANSMQSLCEYWFALVRLPEANPAKVKKTGGVKKDSLK